MKPLRKLLPLIALGIGVFSCVNDDGAFTVPRAFFIVRNKSVADADTTIRIGDTLAVEAAPCVEEIQCQYQWHLTGPDSEFQAEERKVRFVAKRTGDYCLSLFLWEKNSGKEISTHPIFFHIRVRGHFLVDAGADRSVKEDETITFTVAAFEPNRDSLVVALRNPPRGSRFDSSSFRWTPGFDQEGSYLLVFHGRSGSLEASDTILIAVTNVDRPPTLVVPGEMSTDEGNLISFLLTAADEDGDTVKLTVSDLPPKAKFDSGSFTWTPSFQDSGHYRVRFTARSHQLSVSDTVSILVRNMDRKPQLQPISLMPGFEGLPITFAVNTIDPDGDTVTVTASSLPEGAGFSYPIFAWTPSYSDSGSHTVTFIARSQKLSDTLKVSIKVADSDREPRVNSGTDLHVMENQAVIRTVEAWDPDGDPLVVNLNNPPRGASFDSSVFRWTPAFDQAGSYFLVFHGRSGTLESSDTVHITVTNVDRPPALFAPREQSTDEGTRLSFALTASDPDGDSVQYTVSDLPPGAAFDSAGFSWTPSFQDSGRHRVRFTASAGPLSTSDTVFIAVHNVDRKPRIQPLETKAVLEGLPLTFTILAQDVDGDPILVTAEGLPPDAAFQYPLFTWTPGFSASGSHTVTFVASALGLTDTQRVVIAVADSDRGPRLYAGADRHVGENQAVDFTITASDPDGDSVAVDLENPPRGAFFDNLTFRWTPGFDQAGSHRLVFRGLSRGQEFSDTILIIVANVDRPPTLTVPEMQSTDEGSPISFTLNAIDPDGDLVRFEAFDMPPGAVFSSATFSWTPAFQDSGRHQVRFITIAGLLQASDTVLIDVRNVDRKPQLQPVVSKATREGLALTFAVSASDPDGDSVTVAIVSLPQGATFADPLFAWTPSYTDSGSRIVTFVASARALADTQNVVITVADSDRGPLVKAGADQNTGESQAVAFTVGASDSDGDPVVVELRNPPQGALFDGSVFTWIPNYDQAGSYPLVFRGLSRGMEAFDSVLVTVTNVDRSPTLTVPDEQSTDEGIPISFTLSAFDPDGDSIRFIASGLPPGAAFSSAAFSWTPGFNDSGRHRVRFIARAGQLSVSDTVVIRVRNVDRGPQLQPIAPKAIPEGLSLSFAVSALDPDGDSLNVTVGGLPPDAAFQYPLFTWTPGFSASGSHTVTFVASALGLTDTQRVVIAVADSDRGPRLFAGADRHVGENQAVDFTIMASDPDGDSVALWLLNPPLGSHFDSSAFRWTPSFDQAGSYSLVFLGRSKALEALDTLLITVANIDRLPTLDAGQDLSADEGVGLSRKVASADADGDSITMTLLNPPAGASFVGDSLAWMPAFTQAGTYRLVFRARSNGLQAFDTLGITVSNIDRPPLLEAQVPVTIEEGRRGTFQVTVSDPDGDAITVSAQALPPGATFDSLAFDWTPGYQDSGLYQVRFVARAGTLADSQDVPVKVLNVNRAPIASAGPDTTLVLGDSTRLGGSGTDPDGDFLTYGWKAPAGAVLADASAPMPWFRPGSAGQFLFTLRVKDQKDSSAPDFAVVTVLDTAPSSSNRSPVAEAGADRKALPGEIVVLNGSGSSDPDGDPLKYIWRHFSSNPDTTLRLDSTASPAFRPIQPGRYGFILYVFDGEKYSAPDQVQVDINSPDWQVSRRKTGGIFVSSLAEALDSASSGDTIYVEPDTFAVNSDIVVEARHRNVYIFGIDPAATIVDLGCRSMPGNVITLKNTSGVKMEGLTFRYGGRGDDSDIDSVVGGVVVHNSSRIQLVNISSERNCGDGIRLIHSSLVSIEGSRIRNNASNGIRTTSSGFDLVRSSLRDNGSSPSFYGGIAIEGDSTQIGLEGDTLQGNLENQIKITNRSRLVVRNTRIVGSGGGIATTQSARPEIDIAGSAFTGNSGSALFCWDGGSVAVRNTVFEKAGLADSNKAVDFISCAGRLESNRFQGYRLAVTLSSSLADVVGNTFAGNDTDVKVSGGNPPCPSLSANAWSDPPPALDYSGTSCPAPGSP